MVDVVAELRVGGGVASVRVGVATMRVGVVVIVIAPEMGVSVMRGR